MVSAGQAQENVRPALSSFSVAAIRYMEKLEIETFGEAITFWDERAFWDMSPRNFVQLVDIEGKPLEGRLHFFLARHELIDANELEPGESNLRRFYNTEPDETLTIGEDGQVQLSSFLVHGYGLFKDSDKPMYRVGRSFLLVVETPEGEILGTQLSSLDFWLASSKAQGDTSLTIARAISLQEAD